MIIFIFVLTVGEYLLQLECKINADDLLMEADVSAVYVHHY